MMPKCLDLSSKSLRTQVGSGVGRHGWYQQEQCEMVPNAQGDTGLLQTGIRKGSVAGEGAGFHLGPAPPETDGALS